MTKIDFLRRDLEAQLAEVLSISKRDRKKSGICIGNTTKKIKRDYFFTAIRDTASCVSASVIIDSVSLAEEIVKLVDGRLDYIFVDTEKKISQERYGNHDVGNVERAVRSLAKQTKVLTYKGNDLAVDAIDCFLAQLVSEDVRGLGGKKTVIVGVGNIGFKLALKLAERGCHVYVVRRNVAKLKSVVHGLNLIRPAGTIAKIKGESNIQKAVINADIVVGLTPGKGEIKRAMLRKIKKGSILIDGGKGSFDRAAIDWALSHGCSVYRAGISASFEAQMAMLLKMEAVLKNGAGRTVIEGVPVVSGYLLGNKGEVVVDNYRSPKHVYGVANGSGDFNHDLSKSEKMAVKKLRDWILKR